MRRRARILVQVHPGIRWALMAGNHQSPSPAPDEQP
jgi:hypothetical protein